MQRCLLLLICLTVTACGGGSGSGSGGPVGLSERPANSECLAFDATAEVQLTPIAASLSFNSPLLMLPHPSQPGIFYVVEQGGLIYRLDLNTETRSQLVNLATDYSLSECNECGLLGMAFDPEFGSNGFVYLSFTENTNGMTSFVARFESTDEGQSLRRDGSGNLVRSNLVQQRQPFSNHNGGHIAFGPDNLLYVGLGDGGDANDPGNRAQSLSTRLGKMLRFNPDGTPASNEVSGSVPEIYAYGLRNPWRWSFDRDTGELWAGDVGQRQFEEINRISLGGNYGWRCYEGYERTSNSCGASPSGPFIEPVHAYGRSDGISVTGGYVYRGNNMPALRGAYLFSDFGSGTLWALERQPDDSYQRRTLLETGRNVASFAQDRDGELYLVTFSGLFRIDPVNVDVELPQTLSETGCVQADAPWQPADGLIPYRPIEPFWSDGADKIRYMALPDGTRITLDESGDFQFPRGSVLVKNFTLAQRLIETRLYLHNADGSWSGYSYQWNEAGTDAELVNGGRDVDVGGQIWHYPSAGECTQCHTAAAGFTLGLETAQLNSSFTYPQTGRTANQLDTLAGIGVLSAPPTPAQRSRRLSRSTDDTAAIDARARSYLHSNCSHCHRPGGTTQSSMDLRITTPLNATGVCGEPPSNGNLGRDGARLVAPGDAANSLLHLRMVADDANRMPPISTLQVDTRGAQLVADWINQLPGCN
ncbi:PQQ-dependent sugar dehydrogenase [Marinobacter sp. F4218]|uniref:PQQ-dependent sugar dehydrogenase n=1 Tax=Marinobacter sp. F4218 TaxID=2862868 RepID=UPI001C632B92|nr:PQQ-dependent sugar dehydrogenase [Marinobacter sp. F4218]MBW7471650.1 PQQ-dependent sugar dehydrogenase [Marinobacter sp. F4218]